MKKFLDDGFLLNGETARALYENYAKEMPIFDFHCHLNPQEIYEDKKYRSLTEVWLGGDHYKWRLMREMGVDERYITGDADDWEKFSKYAAIMPFCIGNPIYEWTHLELRRYFGIDDILCPASAKSVYDRANEKLLTLTARKMIKNNRVAAIFTTDDPADDLRWHRALLDEKYEVRVSPTFRPDKAIHIERAAFGPWLKSLEAACGKKIGSYSDLTAALCERLDLFASLGCVCSDHALDEVIYEPSTDAEVEAIFQKAGSCALTKSELAKYKGALLVFLGREYAKRAIAQQYHIAAMRNNNTRMFGKLGADTGFDGINDSAVAPSLAALLDEMDKTDSLPKTVLYTLNPADNELLAVLMNCYQRNTPGKIQFGSAWWFNDQYDGMRRQLSALMSVGLVSQFVGMLTDSRSFLSYTRHEYFRRILCDILGGLVDTGRYPDDLATVGGIVSDICFNNANRYFLNR